MIRSKANRPNPLQNALTVDVEDYFHVTGFERHISRRDWRSFESRFQLGMQRILEALDEFGVKATFYVLGWLARRHPQLMRVIDAAGHELGSHSYWHRQVFRMSPQRFRADLRQSQRVLEDAVGKPVTTFRAPSFSITNRSLWAFEILAEEGILVDSSVYPVAHDRYGIADAPMSLHQVSTKGGDVWELPPAVDCLGGMRIPVGGGGYFRLYPIHWTLSRLRRINAQGRPFTCYMHPWEFDPEQPRLSAGGRISRLRHYAQLHTTESKFRRLLSEFSFGRVSDVVGNHERQIQTEATSIGAR